MRIPAAALPKVRLGIVLTFLVACLMVFLFLWTRMGGQLGPLTDGYRVTGSMSDVQNLSYDSDVRIAGVLAGKVRGLETEGGAARVVMQLQDDVAPLHEGASLRLRAARGTRIVGRGGRLWPGLRARRLAAAGQAQLQISAQLAIQPRRRQAAGQRGGLADIAAGGRLVALEPVQEKALVQRLGLAWEGGHDPVAALNRLVELIELHVREAVIDAGAPLGQGLLGAAAQQQHDPHGGDQEGATPWGWRHRGMGISCRIVHRGSWHRPERGSPSGPWSHRHWRCPGCGDCRDRPGSVRSRGRRWGSAPPPR